jgi:hypothetical protein
MNDAGAYTHALMPLDAIFIMLQLTSHATIRILKFEFVRFPPVSSRTGPVNRYRTPPVRSGQSGLKTLEVTFLRARAAYSLFYRSKGSHVTRSQFSKKNAPAFSFQLCAGCGSYIVLKNSTEHSSTHHK